VLSWTITFGIAFGDDPLNKNRKMKL